MKKKMNSTPLSKEESIEIVPFINKMTNLSKVALTHDKTSPFARQLGVNNLKKDGSISASSQKLISDIAKTYSKIETKEQLTDYMFFATYCLRVGELMTSWMSGSDIHFNGEERSIQIHIPDDDVPTLINIMCTILGLKFTEKDVAEKTHVVTNDLGRYEFTASKTSKLYSVFKICAYDNYGQPASMTELTILHSAIKAALEQIGDGNISSLDEFLDSINDKKPVSYKKKKKEPSKTNYLTFGYIMTFTENSVYMSDDLYAAFDRLVKLARRERGVHGFYEEFKIARQVEFEPSDSFTEVEHDDVYLAIGLNDNKIRIMFCHPMLAGNSYSQFKFQYNETDEIATLAHFGDYLKMKNLLGENFSVGSYEAKIISQTEFELEKIN